MVQQQQRTTLTGRLQQQGSRWPRPPRVTKIIAGIILALLLLFNVAGLLFSETTAIVDANAIPIVSGDDRSPIVFACCERLRGEGNRGQLARSLPRDHNAKDLDVVVRYLNAPCFSLEEQQAGNPKDRGQNWPVHKTFSVERVQLFQQRVQEVYQQGGMVLAEVNCKVPQAEVSNVWLESMLRASSQDFQNETMAVTPYVLGRFLLQDKKDLIRIISGHGYQDYVPKHYKEGDTLEYPLVLKREKSEGGVGVYIVHSEEDLEKHIQEDEKYEGMGTRHKKSRHRMIGTGWVLEEFLPGATQELIVYIRPRGTSDGQAYFWCGSHSNQRWHDDGNFVKGFADIHGTVTTPKDCSRHPELLELMNTVMKKEDIYGTGCINYKYGRDGKPKLHDWNLRTCATTATWNKGAVFLDIISQIPKRPGSKRLALFTDGEVSSSLPNSSN